MRHTRATDDPEFRNAAKAVRLRAEDMIPMEGAWCLPLNTPCSSCLTCQSSWLASKSLNRRTQTCYFTERSNPKLPKAAVDEQGLQAGPWEIRFPGWKALEALGNWSQGPAHTALLEASVTAVLSVEIDE
jgi:hypothetical protein